ncbi:hypothetical protein [Paraburkholderia sp. Tr-20389]|uniref:hypothetical protein n=1 Tax=Paraburkholderia sp. Tr-20389 TaxID=2703903 RepID=UPI0019802FE9|nr:hypothetical protein [Paraburkholderia sp. Tr-20389]
MHGTFPVEAGWVVFSRDGRAQFGWRDPETGSFHSEADGERIADAVGGVEFFSDVMH